jgi:hypothetical protein
MSSTSTGPSLGAQFVVMSPAQTGAYSLQFVRYGRIFQTLEAATRTAKRLSGKVRPYGSNEVIADFSSDFELEHMPDTRQRRGQALAAFLGLQS